MHKQNEAGEEMMQEMEMSHDHEHGGEHQ